MKNILLAIASAGLLAGCSKSQKPATPPVEQKPMNPAVSQLDLNGDMALYMNTSTLEKSVLDYIDNMSTAILSSSGATTPGPQFQAITEGINKVKTAIKWSGLFSIDSYAMSMAPVEGTLDRTISIASYSKADANKPLWRILASKPKKLEGIGYVPADAVYTVNGTASLAESWKVVNEATEKLLAPQQAAAFKQKIAMVEMMLGTNVNSVVDSLDNEILVSLQLSKQKQCQMPMGQKVVSIPQPNLLIGLQTKTPLVGQIILQKLQQSGAPVVDSKHAGYTLHTLNLPIPAPFPLAPTIVQTKDYLLIGSNPDAVSKALDSKANGTGLVATPLYKKLLADAPEKTSSLEFLSPRFMQTYMAIMNQTMASMQDQGAKNMMKSMLGGYTNLYSGGYSLKTPTNLYSRCYVNYGGAKPLEMAASAYIGMVSAVAIPLMSGNKERAMETEAQAGCSTISTALRIQWAEHGSFAGIAQPTDLPGIQPGDLDGTYFKEANYTLVSLTDASNYIITANGTGRAKGLHVTLTVKNGQSTWDMGRNPGK